MTSYEIASQSLAEWIRDEEAKLQALDELIAQISESRQLQSDMIASMKRFEVTLHKTHKVLQGETDEVNR